jgi:hypothetical protein
MISLKEIGIFTGQAARGQSMVSFLPNREPECKRAVDDISCWRR